MVSAHQARGRSRNRSGERYSSEYTNNRSVDSTPKAGTKRLFSNRESRQLNGSHASENAELDNTADGGRHSDKRYRNSDWPLSNPNPNPSPSSVSSIRHHLHNRKTPNSPSSSRRSRARSLVRPSKFVEGSMNDRVSQKPPVPYLEPEEEFLSEYNTAACGEGGRGRKLTRSRKFTHHPNVSVAESSANQSDASRSSSLFRFGKSIAASFNPTNWKFWSKEQQQEEEEDEEAAQLRVLQERQAKAERIYQELKESGHFRDSAVGPRLFAPASEKKAGKHDSGIEFGDLDMSSSARGSTSIEEKRKGRVFLEPPKFSQRGESPASTYSASVAQSNASTPNKQKFNFKKPSLANLKKASLSNIKSAFAGESTLSVNEHHQARRVPSRKDLQKQQKLVKRVSNLEERLKQARLQLAEALNEPLPSGSPTTQAPSRVSRSRFVPGALSSLPSERLLSGYVSSEAGFSDDEMPSGIGQAVSTDHAMSNTQFMSGGLGGEQSKDIAASSFHSQEVKQEDSVMQSVEYEEPAQLGSALSSVGDNLQVADTTPTKPKDNGMAEDEDEELTPKPKSKSKLAEPTKKRKSIFERVPDDGGDYTPSGEEPSEDEDNLASDIISEVSSLTNPKSKSNSSSKVPKSINSRSKGPTITLQHPRKLQKTVPGPKNTSVPKTSPPKSSSSVPSSHPSIPPPTRSAPPPPPPGRNTTAGKKSHHQNHNQHITSSPPSGRLTKSNKIPLPPTSRQQSASPPPSSATFTGPSLTYNKPSRNTHKLSPKAPSRHEEDAYIADPAMSPSIPPLPPMPKAVRLASGEVVSTEGMVSGVSSIKHKFSTRSSGNDSGANSDMKREQRERTGMSSSPSKQSFEWPDDVF
ncbi:hypothetical protein BKA65DRAFT_23376 [Rhexocercosporidium sp. MPI-PUGE-AT-0058]|nr:hypothetical protein BKA65DRAFT_23376 [Rhexocercosporidium sp. MPI-PUGE-AT-0058]